MLIIAITEDGARPHAIVDADGNELPVISVQSNLTRAEFLKEFQDGTFDKLTGQPAMNAIREWLQRAAAAEQAEGSEAAD